VLEILLLREESEMMRVEGQVVEATEELLSNYLNLLKELFENTVGDPEEYTEDDIVADFELELEIESVSRLLGYIRLAS
jgi:hypothetical protein